MGRPPDTGVMTCSRPRWIQRWCQAHNDARLSSAVSPAGRDRALSPGRYDGARARNTNPTMSAPACSAASRVSGVDRPQILTISDMVQGRVGAAAPERGARGPGSTTSRPACLAPWPDSRSAAAKPDDGAGRYRADVAPCPRRCPVVPALAAHRPRGGAPRGASAAAGTRRQAAGHHAHDRHRDDDDEQRQPDRNRRIAGIERIERHRHQMTIGDREDDEDHAERNTISARRIFA